MSTIIIGLGNPILTDDSLGIHAVREISRQLQDREDIAFCELCSGGLDLMEAMVGYERAIIIDAAYTGQMKPGTVFSAGTTDLRQSRNTCSNHHGSIEVALEFGMMTGLKLPRDIRIWAVEAEDVETFSNNLTASVQNALPALLGNILHDIENGTNTLREKYS
jgi:hydrogenase maturation protease